MDSNGQSIFFQRVKAIINSGDLESAKNEIDLINTSLVSMNWDYVDIKKYDTTLSKAD